MKVEISQSLELNQIQETLLDLHSFLNILNVFISQYHQIGGLIGDKAPIQPIIDVTTDMISDLKDLERTKRNLSHFHVFKHRVLKTLDQIQEQYSPQTETEKYRLALRTIHSFLEVLEMRCREWLERIQAPEQWLRVDIQYLKNEFSHIFSAVEQYSNGRFRLVDNIASQEDQDYLIRLDIHSTTDDWIFMPSVFQDVMRDLILNARKYTPSGGEIIAGLINDGKTLTFVVQDNGIGICDEDLNQVVQFGYRGRNGVDHRTMGGGFGLTKAYVNTKKFGGQMWIASEVGRGTKITIKIPVPAQT